MIDENIEKDVFEYEDYSDMGLVVRKSNELIEGRNYNTLVQNQLLDVSVAFAKKEKDGIYHAYWEVKDLDAFPGINRHNISKTLKEMEGDNSDVNKNYTVSTKDGFKKFPLVDTLEYDRKGHVHVRFTHGASQYFSKMKDNYTPNLLAITTQFKSMPTYRLYELCSAKAYILYTKNKDEVRFKYDIYELKSKIDPNPKFEFYEQELEKKLGRKVTAKEVYDYAPEKIEKWCVYYEFKRAVLEKAKKEIELYCKISNNNRAFSLDYEVVRSGIGGKVTDIILIITKAALITDEKYEDEDDVVTDDGIEIIPIAFSEEECRCY